ncbi:MAG TPA: HAMP domain-containing sensor histidine kinase [Acidimicrobiales bacterium]|nr:HAMP domain-containing sensor histidine kinase [Acidimicrobiales bacterium]
MRRLGGLLAGLRLRRQTVRMRLTLLYGSLFLLSSAVLLAITYVLVDHNDLFLAQATSTGGQVGHKRVLLRSSHPLPLLPSSFAKLPGAVQLEDAARKALGTRSSDLHELLVGSIIALSVMAGLSVVLGWAVAGRVLRPLRAMADTAQQISADNLHQRLAIQGPDDELKHLAATIDGLLARLEAAFAAQRRFVANASHELRTPLTLERTLLEVALADPGANAASLRAACERAIAAGEVHEHLIESLLTLATSERGLDERSSVDLSALASRELLARHSDFEKKGIQLNADLAPARSSGSPVLLDRLVANLIDNAVQHNIAGGRVDVATSVKSGRALLSVSNTGLTVPAEEIERLFQPFQRFGNSVDGFGLGLSIVKAIAIAHGASLVCHARPGGGLEVEVALPAFST